VAVECVQGAHQPAPYKYRHHLPGHGCTPESPECAVPAFGDTDLDASGRDEVT
jgi:hypothetical protein